MLLRISESDPECISLPNLRDVSGLISESSRDDFSGKIKVEVLQVPNGYSPLLQSYTPSENHSYFSNSEHSSGSVVIRFCTKG